MKTLIDKKVVIRGYYCGNWIGELEAITTMDCKTVILKDAYRLWSWKTKQGVSLSEIAVNGVSEGTIPCAVPKVVLTDCYEIIEATEAAYESVKSTAK